MWEKGCGLIRNTGCKRIQVAAVLVQGIHSLCGIGYPVYPSYSLGGRLSGSTISPWDVSHKSLHTSPPHPLALQLFRCLGMTML
jgi:hypothetical protein